MWNYIETYDNPLCNCPQKVQEVQDLEIFRKDCKGNTTFFEVRSPSGIVLQVYDDLKSAERGAQKEAIKREEYKKAQSNPELERIGLKLKEWGEKYYNKNTE